MSDEGTPFTYSQSEQLGKRIAVLIRHGFSPSRSAEIAMLEIGVGSEEPTNTPSFSWSTSAPLDKLEGYALAMCIRLFGDRGVTPTNLDESMIARLLYAWAWLRWKIRSDQLKTEAEVVKLVSAMNRAHVGDHWSADHQEEVDRARVDLAVLASVGFRCLG